MSSKIKTWLLAWVVLGAAQAFGSEELPDRNTLLPQLQTIGGKEWTVTTIPEGYLMTYAHPVIFYKTMSTNSKVDTNQRLLHGRKDFLRLQIIFARPLTDAELHWKGDANDKLVARQQGVTEEELKWSRNFNLQVEDVPFAANIMKELNRGHFFLCDPRAWARGPKYTVFIVANEAENELISPREAQESLGQVMMGLDVLFKLYLFVE